MDVKLRPTARIPIVQFIDKASNVRCDMSFGNSLAITNTLLLRTYSEIDPRIRPLAYIVKHWVQSRHINSPADGTLSSYGYVICLLYFLQTRPVPLVPNLQKLPPTWTGQSPSNDQMHSDRESDGSRSDPSVNATYFYKSENNPSKAALLSKFAAKNKESVGELLAAYFNFYAWQFDYNSDVVSIQSGKEKNVSKIQKAESDGWPQHERLRYFISSYLIFIFFFIPYFSFIYDLSFLSILLYVFYLFLCTFPFYLYLYLHLFFLFISVEDPFEVWYDVAHVIKSFQMTFIRKEFLRAHTIVTRCLSQSSLHSTDPQNPTDSLLGVHAVQPEHLLTALCEPCEPPSFTSTAKAERALRKNTIEAMADSEDTDL